MNTYTNKRSWSDAFVRLNSQPLDASSVFTTEAEAIQYAKELINGMLPHVGQFIAVAGKPYIVTGIGATNGAVAALATESFATGEANSAVADLTNLFKWLKSITAFNLIKDPQVGYAYAVDSSFTISSSYTVTGEDEKVNKGDLIICTSTTGGNKYLVINTNIDEGVLANFAKSITLDLTNDSLDSAGCKKLHDVWEGIDGGRSVDQPTIVRVSYLNQIIDATLSFEDIHNGTHVATISFIGRFGTSYDGSTNYGMSQHIFEFEYNPISSEEHDYIVTHSYIKMS